MLRDSRPISWIRGARKDFEDFPQGAQIKMARALTVLAEGRLPDIAKHLAGLGAGVMELTLEMPRRRLPHRLCLADRRRYLGRSCFPEKSKLGIKTPKQDIDLVQEQLRRLRERLK